MNEGESITAGSGVFDGVGVPSHTIPGTGVSSQTVDVVNCEEPAGLRETGVEGGLSVGIGTSSGSSFGDDLSTMVNGVSGMGDREGERARWFSSNRRLPRRSVTFEVTGVGSSTLKEGVFSAVRSAGWVAPPRLILNLEVLFLTLGGGSERTPCPAV